MNEHTTDLTDAITPENPETTRSLANFALYAAVAAAGVFVLVKGVQRFADKKAVLVTVKDQPA